MRICRYCAMDAIKEREQSEMDLDNELLHYGDHNDSAWVWATKLTREQKQRISERTGKWMLWPIGKEAIEVWRVICELTRGGSLGIQAKITYREHCIPGDAERLICVYTYDSDDLSDLQRVVNQLRESLDQKYRLIYKEDRMTMAGGYVGTTKRRVSKWYVNPHEMVIHAVRGYTPPRKGEVPS